MDRLTTDVDMYHHTMTFNFPGEYKIAVANMVQGLPTSVKMSVTNEETGKAESQVVEFEPELIENGDTVTLVVHELMEEAVLMAMREARIPEDRVSHPITQKYAKMLENLRRHFEAGGKQLIFTEEKSQHHKLKRIIVHHLPVTVEQIGIINADDAKGERLDKIFKAYNAGQIKIVVANKKAEVGVNLQKGTVAIHHLTLPWTPASINQRNGRGVRQGNKVDTVSVYYYCGKGTFDSYRKELLQAKADWINELLTGTASHAKNGDLTGMEACGGGQGLIGQPFAGAHFRSAQPCYARSTQGGQGPKDRLGDSIAGRKDGSCQVRWKAYRGYGGADCPPEGCPEQFG